MVVTVYVNLIVSLLSRDSREIKLGMKNRNFCRKGLNFHTAPFIEYILKYIQMKMTIIALINISGCMYSMAAFGPVLGFLLGAYLLSFHMNSLTEIISIGKYISLLMYLHL